jgi:ATP-binding cassette subfamily B protein
VSALQYALDAVLTGHFVDHLLRLPIPFLTKRSTSDLLTRIQSNANIREIAEAIWVAALDGFLVLGYAGLMVAYAPRLALAALLFTVVRPLVLGSRMGALERQSILEIIARTRQTGAALEGVGHPEAVKACRAEPRIAVRFLNRLVDRLNAQEARSNVQEAAMQICTALHWAGYGCILFLGGRAVVRGELTVGVLASFLLMYSLIGTQLDSALGAFQLVVRLGAYLERQDDVLEAAPERAGTRSARGLTGAVDLVDVGFGYTKTGPPVLRNIHLRVAPGERIAIVGRSGQGKSTLAHLIVGLLEPRSGTIRFDGDNLRDLDASELHQRIGIAVQQPVFFDASVEFNVTLGRPIPRDALERAARIACIDEVINRLPHGFATVLGENAHRLSGGQRQRLALARALACEPRILLLDEATSSLELELEARVHANLSALKCTRIVVAHRLATVMDADRIVVLDGGTIVQQGTYAQLAGSPGVFRDVILRGEAAAA